MGVEFTDVVDGENVRVIQRRDQFRFALKSSTRRCIAKLVGKKLNGNRTMEFGVERSEHEPHAAAAQGRDDLVRADFRPGLQFDGQFGSLNPRARFYDAPRSKWMVSASHVLCTDRRLTHP